MTNDQKLLKVCGCLDSILKFLMVTNDLSQLTDETFNSLMMSHRLLEDVVSELEVD